MLLPTDLKGLPFTIPHIPTEISPHTHYAKVNLLCETTLLAFIVLGEHINLYFHTRTFLHKHLRSLQMLLYPFQGYIFLQKYTNILKQQKTVRGSKNHLLECVHMHRERASNNLQFACSSNLAVTVALKVGLHSDMQAAATRFLHSVNHNGIHYATEHGGFQEAEMCIDWMLNADA